jgi:lipid-A-disaccharide synthase
VAGMNKNSEYRKIMVVAGEASGDLHAASLVEALRRLDPTIRFYGVGGEKLREAGVNLLADSADMAVIGLTEVFLKLPLILKVMRKLKRSFDEEKPAAAILVDYPDFNLRLAQAAHKKGIKVFYYISPQVWAWRKGRIRTIREVVDKMAVILPFEASFYREAGVDAVFVGHPLLDAIPEPSSREEARKKLGLREGIQTVGILPGSRRSEVTRLLPVCLEAAEKMQKNADLQFVLPLANTLSQDFVDEIIRRYKVDISVMPHAIYDVLAAADLAIVASGTATLEAALLKTPMIIIYKVSWLSSVLGRVLIHVKHIGLANIIAGKTIVPELIQSEANPAAIATLAGELLKNGEKREAMQEELSKIKDKLGTPGAAERAARLVYDMLKS